MAKVGRPRALDETKKREVCALVSAGGSLDFAGRYVGCSAKTIRREAERDAAFDDRLRKSQLGAQLEPLRALRQKATTHWRAAAWLLERADPEQFVRLDQKLYKPQEVADLLQNIHESLRNHVSHLPSQVIACGIIDMAQRQASLPRGQRKAHVNLCDLPSGYPELLDPILRQGAARNTEKEDELLDTEDANSQNDAHSVPVWHTADHENQQRSRTVKDNSREF